MSTIPGYMGKRSLRWLQSTASRAKVVVEVGAWLGRGTVALAARCPGVVYSVDTWKGVPDDADQHKLYEDVVDPFKVWKANTEAFRASDKVVPMRGESTAIAQAWKQEGRLADLVFIDADHRYEAVKADIEAWAGVIRKGGVLSGHDYHWPGVHRAVTEAFGDNLHRGPNSIWWVQL